MFQGFDLEKERLDLQSLIDEKGPNWVWPCRHRLCDLLKLRNLLNNFLEQSPQFRNFSFIKLSNPLKCIFRPAIPDETGHPFRLIPATDSGASRPPIPEHSGHPFN
jgi:hypothetical protein